MVAIWKRRFKKRTNLNGGVLVKAKSGGSNENKKVKSTLPRTRLNGGDLGGSPLFVLALALRFPFVSAFVIPFSFTFPL